MLDAGYSMLDPRYWMLDAGCSMLDAGYLILGARCWMLDAGCSMLDARSWMLDTRCWMLDAGCSMLDAGSDGSAVGTGCKVEGLRYRVKSSRLKAQRRKRGVG